MRSCTEMNCSNPVPGNSPMFTVNLQRLSLLAGVCLLAGCTMLPRPQSVAMDKYVLEYVPQEVVPAVQGELPVMVITLPRAHGGYDTARIAYRQQPYGLRYFAKNRWADSPARMLAPLVAEAMNHSGAFQGMYATHDTLSASYRLDSELMHFYQDFTAQPSEVHIALRAQLVSLDENRVLATQIFDVREAAPSDDPYGGVQAANRATRRLLDQLAQFCKTQTGR